jgi:biotin carboxylase
MVESNTTGTGQTFAVAARARGLRPVLLSRRPERYPWAAEDDVDVVLADTTEATSVVAAAGADAVGLVTSSEYFVVVAAQAAARLGLPGSDPTAVEGCRDKRRQRQALQRAGVPVPAFAAAASPQEAVKAARAIGFPVVLKPADGTGSRGVRLCSEPAEVLEHTGALLARRRDERGQPVIPAVLVEEYVAGPEVSVETFGSQVIGITDKHLGPLPAFVESGHDFPATLEPLCPASPEERVSAVTLAALDALGLGFGPSHTEVRLGSLGPVVIEVNPRLAGGRIPTLIRLATGIDLVGATVEAATGARSPLPEPGPGHASIRFLVARQGGRVRRTAGVAEAAAIPGVVDVAITARPGQSVGGTDSFLDRIGHVIAAAPTAPAARAAAETALSMLQVDVDTDDTATASEPGRPDSEQVRNWRSFAGIERKRNASSEEAPTARQLAFVYRDRAEKERRFGEVGETVKATVDGTPPRQQARNVVG